MPQLETQADAFYAALGRNVRRAREDAGLTQEQLSKNVHLTRASIANLERGRQRISAFHLILIATAVGADVGALAPAVSPTLSPELEGADPEHLALLQSVLETASKGRG